MILGFSDFGYWDLEVYVMVLLFENVFSSYIGGQFNYCGVFVLVIFIFVVVYCAY